MKYAIVNCQHDGRTCDVIVFHDDKASRFLAVTSGCYQGTASTAHEAMAQALDLWAKDGYSEQAITPPKRWKVRSLADVVIDGWPSRPSGFGLSAHDDYRRCWTHFAKEVPV